MNVAIADTARGPVEYARTGAGPAVLVIHGTPGSWRQAVPLARDLSDAFDVILPSRPGYGRTPLRTGSTPQAQASSYAALLDTLGIERAAVIGISGGGPSSFFFARDPRATALVLCCSVAAHLVTVPSGMRIGFAVPGLAASVSALQRVAGRRRVRDPAQVRRYAQKELTADEWQRAQDDPAIITDLAAFLRSHLDAPAGLRGLRNDLANFDVARHSDPARPPQIPTLVQHGDADAVVGMDHARFHAAAIPGATLQVFENAGHVFLFTRRREATAGIRRFLAEVLHHDIRETT